MSFGKLDKYGVPINTNDDERGALIQPKFNSRFRVFLLDFGDLRSTAAVNNEDGITFVDKDVILPSSVLTSMVESFTRPTLNFGTQETNSFIGRAKYSGRLKHENFTMVLRDDITNSVISKVYAQAKKQTYKFHPTTRSQEKSPYLGIDTKFICIMQVMDGRTNHKSLETWTFYGCTIDNIESVTNSYDDGAGIAKLTITCAFDYFDISQESRLILPPSYAYDDGNSGGNTPAGSRPTANEDDEDGLFDSIGNSVGGFVDSATDAGGQLFDKVKSASSGFFTSESDEARLIDPDDPSVGGWKNDLW